MACLLEQYSSTHEMEKENLCSVFKSLLVFVAVTQMAVLSQNRYKAVLSVKKHISIGCMWKVCKDCVFTYCVDQYEDFSLIIFKRKMKAN